MEGTPGAQSIMIGRKNLQLYRIECDWAAERTWQCRFTVPHAANYACVDPEMRIGKAYINPFSASQVERWHKAQARAKAGASDEESEAPPAE